jgi:hypothetical protein
MTTTPGENAVSLDAEVEMARRTREAAETLERENREHDARVAEIAAAHWKGGRGLASPIGAKSKRGRLGWVALGSGVFILVAAMVVPLLWATHELHQTSSGVISDLGQFSKYEQNQPYSEAAVTRVENNAVRTSSGGATIWAERVGTKCWGVVVSGGTASGVEPQVMSLCK